MPLELDVKAILHELDKLGAEHPNPSGRISLTQDQMTVLMHQEDTARVTWGEFMKFWKGLGFPGSETSLRRFIREEKARRAKEGK